MGDQKAFSRIKNKYLVKRGRAFTFDNFNTLVTKYKIMQKRKFKSEIIDRTHLKVIVQHFRKI